MVILMKPDASKCQVGCVLEAIRGRGFEPRFITAAPAVTLGIVEEMDRTTFGMMTELISGMTGVDCIEGFETSWKLASAVFHTGRTSVRIGPGSIGGGDLCLIAGPCAVESRQGILEIARAVRSMGACMLRGGAFKPRTSPYSFRGLGEEALEYLAEASAVTGLPVVTEVISPDDVPLVSRYADMLQIGARNMQNYALLEAVGDSDKPILLKRGMNATVSELLLAAEYILARGNPRVVLCERGIRTFETEVRNTLDAAVIPLLRSLTHLPVIADPSHATGRRDLVVPAALAAVAAGADGLIVEVHTDPDKALSDGMQSLDLPGFGRLVELAGKVHDAISGEIPT